MTILAQLQANAPPEFTGHWIIVAVLVMQGLGALFGLFRYFATRREHEAMERRQEVFDVFMRSAPERAAELYQRLDRSDEARTSGIHNRLNPLEKQLEYERGRLEAFSEAFEKFTRIIESTSRQTNDQIKAFTETLDTFARLVADRHSNSK